MLFFFRSIFIQIFLNAFISYRIWKSRDLSKFWKYALITIYVAEALMYFTGLLAMHKLPVEIFGIIVKISGIWSIYQIYLTTLILTFDLVFYLKRSSNYFYKFREKQIRRVKITCFLCINIFIWISLVVSYHNFLNPIVKKYDFSFNNRNSVQTCKILIASDLHLGYIINKRMLNKYVDLINSQHPDIIVFIGDLIDWDMRPLIETGMQDDLRKIKASKGVYFVTGNHEYKLVDIETKLDWIAESGMTILKDTIENIDNKLWLIGRDDKDNKKRKSMDELMKGFDTSKPCIMLAHRPSDIKDACEYNIPLNICGHTHAGQIFPANLFYRLFFSRSYGWSDKNGCCSYTTSGLGVSGFPLRSGSRCEVVVFNIRIY
ncbi:MAG: metallophosphoesterase [Candidatus Azobacteroides sp.]|nr:metallophosphoesterase [Candidatus Azobacteroides sp.]